MHRLVTAERLRPGARTRGQFRRAGQRCGGLCPGGARQSLQFPRGPRAPRRLSYRMVVRHGQPQGCPGQCLRRAMDAVSQRIEGRSRPTGLARFNRVARPRRRHLRHPPLRRRTPGPGWRGASRGPGRAVQRLDRRLELRQPPRRRQPPGRHATQGQWRAICVRPAPDFQPPAGAARRPWLQPQIRPGPGVVLLQPAVFHCQRQRQPRRPYLPGQRPSLARPRVEQPTPGRQPDRLGLVLPAPGPRRAADAVSRAAERQRRLPHRHLDRRPGPHPDLAQQRHPTHTADHHGHRRAQHSHTLVAENSRQTAGHHHRSRQPEGVDGPGYSVLGRAGAV
ncbi:hypothetical protein PFLuk1_04535 [Pseudomonas fluorescens]|nr:hypothetical protein PFLuk1_04535 [Pseudomonas fluorescens]